MILNNKNIIEFILHIPLLLTILQSLLSGIMAKSFNRKFWTWFIIAIPLPLISSIILLCLPDKQKEKNSVSDFKKKCI
jgi:hypothetical protein